MSEQGFSQYPLSRYPAEAGFARWDTWQSCVAAGNDTLPCRTKLPVADRLSQFYGTTIRPFEVFERNFVQRLFETGYIGTYSGAVSGGTNGVTYYVNGRYFNENGPFGGSNLGPAADIDRKAQGTATLDLVPTDRIKVRVERSEVGRGYRGRMRLAFEQLDPGRQRVLARHGGAKALLPAGGGGRERERDDHDENEGADQHHSTIGAAGGRFKRPDESLRGRRCPA